jgi:hypothetical protein
MINLIKSHPRIRNQQFGTGTCGDLSQSSLPTPDSSLASLARFNVRRLGPVHMGCAEGPALVIFFESKIS